MQGALFIARFNNSGKTKIIETLFNRQRFFQGWFYTIPSVKAILTVESHSNDDYLGVNWSREFTKRLDNEVHSDLHLFNALCSIMHDNNRFTNWLLQPLFDRHDKLHVFLIEFKFEHYAQLMIDNILQTCAIMPCSSFAIINADAKMQAEDQRFTVKMNQISINGHLPIKERSLTNIDN